MPRAFVVKRPGYVNWQEVAVSRIYAAGTNDLNGGERGPY